MRERRLKKEIYSSQTNTFVLFFRRRVCCVGNQNIFIYLLHVLYSHMVPNFCIFILQFYFPLLQYIIRYCISEWPFFVASMKSDFITKNCWKCSRATKISVLFTPVIFDAECEGTMYRSFSIIKQYISAAEICCSCTALPLISRTIGQITLAFWVSLFKQF